MKVKHLAILAALTMLLGAGASPAFSGQSNSPFPVADGCLTDEDLLPDDSVALEGVEIGRIFWDVTIADPSLLAGRLGVIDQTYRDMVRQGVTPEMVLAFRGGSVRLLVADHSRLPEETREGAQSVQQRLERLMELPGVRLEACYIAMRRVPLEPQNLMPGLHTVNNTFLSAMGYGQRGFISIPIH
ncbi:hypothetical protein [Desulfonatronum thioautotrophicum]|uniref:hypothetical protein n=1 Tax=Desulfonatronum thioautotrophicum TaxID=617001 RepID=UPI00069BE9F4|nr:hypothetical protein [Desulfonatronum thioautotrophicum]